MLSFLYVYSDHSILECYNLFSGVELSMRSFFVIYWRTCEDNLTVKHASKKSDMRRKKKANMLIYIVFGRKLIILMDLLKLTLGKPFEPL